MLSGNSHSYASIDVPLPKRETETSKRQSKKFLWVLFASLAVLSVVGYFSQHIYDTKPAPVHSFQSIKAHVGVCERWAGGRITNGFKAFDIPNANKIDITFDVTLDNARASWYNILQIGDHQNDEWPAIFYTNNLAGTVRMEVQFESQRDRRPYGSGTDIAAGQKYAVRLLIDGLQGTFYLDGTQVATWPLPAAMKPISGPLAVYAANPGFNPTAQGTMENLLVCTDGASPCQTYIGGPLERGKKLFDTAFNNKMSLKFKFTIDTGSEFGNIVQIGGKGDDEWPAIFFHHTGTGTDGTTLVTVQFESEGNAEYFAKELAPISYDQEYLLQVDIDGLNCKIYLDGVVKHDFTIPSQFQPVGVTSLPVYASGDWNAPATGSIGYLSVCTGENEHAAFPTQDPTVSPSRSPTSAPTPAPTGSPTPAPTGSPTPAPTGSPTPSPTPAPTGSPTPAPTGSPTPAPTGSPTPAPTGAPTPAPTGSPTPAPTGSPTPAPTGSPTPAPTGSPTPAPTGSPTPAPTKSPTRSPTTTIPQAACQLYANDAGGVLVRDTSVFMTPLTSKMEVNFKLKVNAVSSVWASIVHIGETNFERAPGVWLFPSNLKRLHFTFNGGQTHFHDQDSYNPDIELGVEYDIRIIIDGYNAKIYFGETLKADIQLETNDRFFRDAVPVYAADPWHIAANAVVQDLYVCTEPKAGNDPSLCQEYHGGKIVKNTEVFEVPYTPVMDVEFYVVIDSGSTTWENVIQVGGHGDDEFPAVFFRKGSPPNHLDVQFESQRSRPGVWKIVEITPGKLHLLRVFIDGTKVTIYLDGTQKFQFDISSAYLPIVKRIPVYASGDWNPAAHGSLGSLRVCNGEDPAPLKPAAEECKTWDNSGGAVLKRDDAVFTIPTRERMEITFSLKVNAVSSVWASILHIGATNFERNPGLWLFPSNAKRLHFTFNGGQNHWYDQDSFNPYIELNQEYQIRVSVMGYRAKIFIDGELKANLQLEANDRFYREVVPVYVADPWHNAANAVVKNLQVCSSKSTNPQAPAPIHACNLHANEEGARLEYFNRLFDTPITTNMEVSFKVTINAVSAVWANILHIGANNFERQPGVWLFPNNEKKLHITFNGGQTHWNDQDTFNPVIELNKEYDVRIIITGLNAEIYFGLELVGYLQLEANDRFYRGSVPVYSADPWHTPANAVVKDLRVCTQGGAAASVCQEYRGGEIVRNTKLFSAPYTNVMDVEFYAVIDTGSSFGNVIQIGGHGDDEWPAIFFNKGTPPNYLDVQFERQGNSAYFSRKVEIVPGKQHLLRVLIEDLKCTIFLDGVQKFYYDIPSQYRPVVATMPVYASGDWNNPARGSLGRMRVCNGQDNTPLPVETGTCQYKANPTGAKLLRSSLAFNTAVKSKMEISFDLKVFGTSPSWANIIHIGATNYERSPGMWVFPSNQKSFHFGFNGGQTNFNTQDVYNMAFDLNKEYAVRIYMDGLMAKIFFDGQLKSTLLLETNDRFYRDSVPVYTADPWHIAANAYVKNLRVCYFG